MDTYDKSQSNVKRESRILNLFECISNNDVYRRPLGIYIEQVRRYVRGLCGTKIWLPDKTDPDLSTEQWLQETVEESDIFLLYLTKNSLRNSWVNLELSFAKKSQQSNGNPKIIIAMLEKRSIPKTLAIHAVIDLTENLEGKVMDLQHAVLV